MMDRYTYPAPRPHPPTPPPKKKANTKLRLRWYISFFTTILFRQRHLRYRLHVANTNLKNQTELLTNIHVWTILYCNAFVAKLFLTGIECVCGWHRKTKAKNMYFFVSKHFIYVNNFSWLLYPAYLLQKDDDCKSGNQWSRDLFCRSIYLCVSNINQRRQTWTFHF